MQKMLPEVGSGPVQGSPKCWGAGELSGPSMFELHPVGFSPAVKHASEPEGQLRDAGRRQVVGLSNPSHPAPVHIHSSPAPPLAQSPMLAPSHPGTRLRGWCQASPAAVCLWPGAGFWGQNLWRGQSGCPAALRALPSRWALQHSLTYFLWRQSRASRSRAWGSFSATCRCLPANGAG